MWFKAPWWQWPPPPDVDAITAWTAMGALAAVATALIAAYTLTAIQSDSRDRSRPIMSA